MSYYPYSLKLDLIVTIHNIYIYPLVICYVAIENDPVEIVDFPINSMVIFHSYVKLPEGNDRTKITKYGFGMLWV